MAHGKKKTGSPKSAKMEYDKMPERKSASIEKAKNGYVVRGSRGYGMDEQIYVEKTKKAAKERAGKLL